MAISYKGKKEYEGAVIHTHIVDFYNDSYQYAIVWDSEKEELLDVSYASAEGWQGGTATVDASDELLYHIKVRLWDMFLAESKRRYYPDNPYMMVGYKVRSLTTRGKNKGVIGVVKRTVWSRYGYDKHILKVETEEGNIHWIDADRVAIVPTAEQDNAIIENAQRIAYSPELWSRRFIVECNRYMDKHPR